MKNNSLELSKKAEYEWHPSFKSPMRHTDVRLVVKELKELNDTYGEVTPALLVEHSRNKKSLLHEYFEWNDAAAADSYRYRQAASLLSNIEVTIIREEKPVRMQAYQVKAVPYKKGASTYTKFDALTQDNHTYILKTAARDLQRVKNKLHANDHEEAIPHISRAIKILQNVSEVISVKAKK